MSKRLSKPNKKIIIKRVKEIRIQIGYSSIKMKFLNSVKYYGQKFSYFKSCSSYKFFQLNILKGFTLWKLLDNVCLLNFIGGKPLIGLAKRRKQYEKLIKQYWIMKYDKFQKQHIKTKTSK